MKIKRLLLSVIAVATVLVSVALVAPTATSATATAGAAQVQLDITPIDVNLSLEPGETYDGKFSIINLGADTVDFHVVASGFYVKDMTYETTFDEGSPFSQIADWVTFDKLNFYNLKPNERQGVSYHIKVPKDAPSGGQYAVLFAIVSDQTITKSADVKTDSRVGMKIYARVAGDTRTAGEVESVVQAGFTLKGPLSSVARVKNTGNVDFSSKNEYIVTSLSGDELFSGSTVSRIMPGTTREIDTKWEKTPSFGIFKVRNKISFLGKTHYDNEKIVIIAPIWLILILASVLLLVVGLILCLAMFIKRKLCHRKSHKKRKST